MRELKYKQCTIQEMWGKKTFLRAYFMSTELQHLKPKIREYLWLYGACRQDEKTIR